MPVLDHDVEGTVGARFMLKRSAEVRTVLVLTLCINSTRASGGVQASTPD